MAIPADNASINGFLQRVGRGGIGLLDGGKPGDGLAVGGDLHHLIGLHPAELFGEVGLEIPHRHLACDYFRHG